MKTPIYSLILWIAMIPTLQAQDMGFRPFIYEKNGKTLPYQLLLPIDYNPDKKYPLVLFLHGSGERGEDNQLQLVHGSALFLSKENRQRYPAIIVFPQCPTGAYWATLNGKLTDALPFLEKPKKNPTLKLVEGLLRQIQSDYGVDKNKIYVGGLSMGGMGTFELVYRKPRKFAAAFAICGGANPKIARKIRRPVWRIDHGEEDRVVPIRHSERMVEALRKENAEISYFSYPGVFHDSWNNVFADPNFLPWLFAQRKP